MGAAKDAATAAANSGADDLRRLGVSYLGWPLHILGSFLVLVMTEIIALISRRRRRDGLEGKQVATPTLPVQPQPLVRLQNLSQSEEYFVNRRGRVIHVRSYIPRDAADIKAVILFCHGYGSHCNSPRKHEMGMAMPAQGLCMIQMDLEGHGYSGGERAYIEDYKHWVDDYRQLLELIAGEATQSIGAGGVAPRFFKATPAQRRRLREVPIFVSGESLGGALSILVGISLYETNHPLLPRFKGEVLLAPAIKGNPPPPLLVSLLRNFVAPLIPRWQIPSCLESVNRPEMCVLEVDERRNANHDVLGYPGGLGWGGNMRFRTGLNLIDLTAQVSEKLHHVKFPFLIMHDPGDNIVRFDSSEELAYRASTPPGSPRGRELRPMEGWLHSLLTNCPELAIQHFQDWVLYQTKLCSERAGGSASGGPRPRGSSRKSVTLADTDAIRDDMRARRGSMEDFSWGRVGTVQDTADFRSLGCARAAAAAMAPDTGALGMAGFPHLSSARRLSHKTLPGDFALDLESKAGGADVAGVSPGAITRAADGVSSRLSQAHPPPPPLESELRVDVVDEPGPLLDATTAETLMRGVVVPGVSEISGDLRIDSPSSILGAVASGAGGGAGVGGDGND